MKALIIEAERTGYEPSQVWETMTVGELAETFERIAKNEGWDTKVFLRHDRGYTYGGITSYDLEVEEIEDDEDETEDEEEA